MKHLTILVLLLLLAISGKAQDSIVTKQGDTILCRITRISEQYIHYVIEEQSVRSRIPLDQVLSYNQAVKTNPINEQVGSPPTGQSIENQEPVTSPAISKLSDLENLIQWRLALNAGYTYQYGGYKTQPPDYQSQARSLFNYGGDIQYFANDFLGVGLKFNHATTNTYSEVLFDFTNFSETISFTYLGLTLINKRSSPYDDNLFYYAASGGLISYEVDASDDGTPYSETGKTVGLHLEVGYDFLIGNHYGIGMNLGVNLAKLNTITVVGASLPFLPPQGATFRNIDFSVSRIDFTVGVRLFN